MNVNKISHCRVMVEDITASLPRSNFSEDELDVAASLIIKMEGTISPLVLLQTKIDAYIITEGNFEYYAAVKANCETINAFVYELEGETLLYKEQVSIFRENREKEKLQLEVKNLKREYSSLKFRCQKAESDVVAYKQQYAASQDQAQSEINALFKRCEDLQNSLMTEKESPAIDGVVVGDLVRKTDDLKVQVGNAQYELSALRSLIGQEPQTKYVGYVKLNDFTKEFKFDLPSQINNESEIDKAASDTAFEQYFTWTYWISEDKELIDLYDDHLAYEGSIKDVNGKEENFFEFLVPKGAALPNEEEVKRVARKNAFDSLEIRWERVVETKDDNVKEAALIDDYLVDFKCVFNLKELKMLSGKIQTEQKFSIREKAMFWRKEGKKAGEIAKLLMSEYKIGKPVFKEGRLQEVKMLAAQTIGRWLNG